MTSEQTFTYEGVDSSGERRRGEIIAADERLAATRLASEGLTVLALRPARPQRSGARSGRKITFSDRVVVMRQLALMLDAGVNLLEALDTVAAGLESVAAADQFRAVITALRAGESFATALEAHAPGFPFYVYAMVRVGESTGRVAAVLRDATEQMAYEDRLRRDFVNSLTYPGLLLGAGLLAILFIFTQVVPRFADMIGDDRSGMPWVSRAVLGTGEFVSANLMLVLMSAGGLVLALAAILAQPATRTAANSAMLRAPVIGPILQAREIAVWSRLTGFALGAGVPLLNAVQLGRRAVPSGPFHAALRTLETDLRSGQTLDASLGRHGGLTRMDLSLLKAGQKSGALASVFAYIASAYEDRLKDRLKRLTALVEPLAIGVVSVIVGVVALSLVIALSSVYETVS